MLIYAHRGASADFPEMSRAAYLAAVEQYADGFECDLRLTRDGFLICFHDDDLTRIADVPLVVAESSLAELRSHTEILTFEELLDIALTHKKNLALETKHPVPTRGRVEVLLLSQLEARQREIKNAGIDIAIMSFSWWAVRRVRRSEYESVYLIAHRWQRILSRFVAIGPGIFLIRGDHGLSAKLRSKGRRLFIWTVNSIEDLEIAIRAKADVVMSDRPGEMKAALRSREALDS